MKQKKYSESKIKTAQDFLSRYEVSFDALNERQKKNVVGYVTIKKLLALSLSALVFALVVFSVMAYVTYQKADSRIIDISKTSTFENEDALLIYGKTCFKWGFNVGLYSFTAFMMLIYIIFTSVGISTKFYILDAFLPALKQSSDDNQIPSN